MHDPLCWEEMETTLFARPQEGPFQIDGRLSN